MERIRRKIRAWRDDRNDDQPMQNNSQREQFVGMLQKRYRYTKDKAASELNEHYSKAKLR